MFCALNQNENLSSSATQTHTHTRTQIHIQTNQTEKEKKNTMKKNWWKSVRAQKLEYSKQKPQTKWHYNAQHLICSLKRSIRKFGGRFRRQIPSLECFMLSSTAGTGVFHLYQPSSINFSFWRWRCGCARLLFLFQWLNRQ